MVQDVDEIQFTITASCNRATETEEAVCVQEGSLSYSPSSLTNSIPHLHARVLATQVRRTIRLILTCPDQSNRSPHSGGAFHHPVTPSVHPSRVIHAIIHQGRNVVKKRMRSSPKKSNTCRRIEEKEKKRSQQTPESSVKHTVVYTKACAVSPSKLSAIH